MNQKYKDCGNLEISVRDVQHRRFENRKLYTNKLKISKKIMKCMDRKNSIWQLALRLWILAHLNIALATVNIVLTQVPVLYN